MAVKDVVFGSICRQQGGAGKKCEAYLVKIQGATVGEKGAMLGERSRAQKNSDVDQRPEHIISG